LGEDQLTLLFDGFGVRLVDAGRERGRWGGGEIGRGSRWVRGCIFIFYCAQEMPSSSSSSRREGMRDTDNKVNREKALHPYTLSHGPVSKRREGGRLISSASLILGGEDRRR